MKPAERAAVGSAGPGWNWAGIMPLLGCSCTQNLPSVSPCLALTALYSGDIQLETFSFSSLIYKQRCEASVNYTIAESIWCRLNTYNLIGLLAAGFALSQAQTGTRNLNWTVWCAHGLTHANTPWDIPGDNWLECTENQPLRAGCDRDFCRCEDLPGRKCICNLFKCSLIVSELSVLCFFTAASEISCWKLLGGTRMQNYSRSRSRGF